MSDDIEWTETPDDRFSDAEATDVPLSTGLYDLTCVECGSTPMMVLEPDADNPTWTGECCDNRYSISVETVRITRSRSDL